MKPFVELIELRRRRPSVLGCKSAFAAAILFCLLTMGCGRPAEPLPPKAARPVTFFTLGKWRPEGSYMVSGAVKSWKTEQIGFEVAGRVEWVLEPGKDIEPRIVMPDGTLYREGTPLAKLETDRYNVALASAEAELNVAEREKEAIDIRLHESLPEEIKSAQFDLELAKTEFGRIQELWEKNAASQAERDQAENLVNTRTSRVDSLMASKNQARAQLQAAAAQVERARQAVVDARRDLENTTLYAAYQGQISEVHVVPGSVAAPGSPVLTLVMMDPIKIEVELSADESRKFKRRRHVPVSYKLPDDEHPKIRDENLKTQNAMVYNVDTSADLTTRTFSLTLLLVNEKYRQLPPDVEGVARMARTADIWPLGVINRIIGVDDDLDLVEQGAILQDERGHYVYQLTNANMGETFPEVLKVQRQPLTLEDIRIPFLGIWMFQAVRFANQYDIHDDSLFVGELEIDGGSMSRWDGESVILDSGAQWVLRPGDLVSVDLSGDSIEAGFYVPADAIYEESGTTSLFAVEGKTVRKLNVETVRYDPLEADSMVEVRSPDLREGMQIVLDGVHYLEDGDRVQPIGQVEIQQPLSQR